VRNASRCYGQPELVFQPHSDWTLFSPLRFRFAQSDTGCLLLEGNCVAALTTRSPDPHLAIGIRHQEGGVDPNNQARGRLPTGGEDLVTGG
jgi:hypothetical protein